MADMNDRFMPGHLLPSIGSYQILRHSYTVWACRPSEKFGPAPSRTTLFTLKPAAESGYVELVDCPNCPDGMKVFSV